VSQFFQGTTRALCRRPNLARAMIRAVATGEPELTQKMAAFHDRMTEYIATALRGELVTGEVDRFSDEERAIARSLQMVWFASLVGWCGGLYGQAGIVDQTCAAAELMLSHADL
jgi:hypothetical protein